MIDPRVSETFAENRRQQCEPRYHRVRVSQATTEHLQRTQRTQGPSGSDPRAGSSGGVGMGVDGWGLAAMR